MGIARLTNLTRLAALLIAITALTTGKANAQHLAHHGGLFLDEWAGYAVPIQDVYQFPASIVWQPTSSDGYAVPIQSVYQFPASFVTQRGVALPLAPPRPLYIPAGDHHVLLR
jgi:hypothetical protein